MNVLKKKVKFVKWRYDYRLWIVLDTHHWAEQNFRLNKTAFVLIYGQIFLLVDPFIYAATLFEIIT